MATERLMFISLTVSSSVLLDIPPFSLNLIQNVQNMLSVDFMQSAFLAGTVLAIVAGLVGYFVVLRHLVFAVEALSHVTFTGALLAAVVGQQPIVGLFGVTALVALAMGLLGNRSARSRDVEVGTVLAWVLGLGVLFLSMYTTTSSGAKGSLGVNILFGSILGLQPQQVQWITIVGTLAIAAILAIARPLLFASVDSDVAAVRGIPVRGLNILFLVLVAISVAAAVPAVGVLLNSALIVTPAAIAQRLVSRPFMALLLSAVIALLFTWVGLTIGFYAPVPISFLMSAIAFLSYVLVATFSRKN
ncbi:MAG: metal ABC transporter permease [Drouetiella hepatica Uher 2000/2452]|uniref:Metal ABC transporter permease n=1 Tax=Drouetiella hepatica Uher 2000/2452 TaxID=904376 RepID=A0A951Q5K2_9CYAN|nr:metal ABC transporter permease [Drouetiella hepatica Uher 2000/2452]